MKALGPFKHDEFGNIRLLEENGNLYICGMDIANALKIKNPVAAVKAVSDKVSTVSVGKSQPVEFIPLSAAQELIQNFYDSPKAPRFDQWLFGSIVPELQRQINARKAEAAKNIKGVTNLINVLCGIMRAQGSTPREVAKQAKLLCEQFNIPLIDNFVHSNTKEKEKEVGVI